jgi:putative molybdopterin biosynthesis protein
MDRVRAYTVLELAEILQVTRRTVYNYIKNGTLPAFKIGKEWRVNEPALKAFLRYKETPVV